jgi:hypothetical protein
MDLNLAIAGKTIVEHMAGRQVLKAGMPYGYAFVLTFDGLDIATIPFDTMAKGSAKSTGGKLSWTTIGGQRVALIDAVSAKAAMYRLGDEVVMVAGTTMKASKAIVAAVIKAN